MPTGKKFQSRFIIPGVAGYPGQFGNVLITKESLDKFVKTLETRPVIIQHQTVTDENVKDLEVGRVHNVWYNEKDGWYWCDGVITSDEAIDLINKGWSVSCSYNVLLADDKGGTENNIPYDMEFLDGVFTHLAIVNNPRYERANIVFNSKTVIAPIEIDITNEVKSNKEIQFLNGLKEILKSLTEPTQEDLRVLNGLSEIFNSFPDHQGRKGQVGGSLPRENKGLSIEEKLKNIKPISINKKDIPIFHNPKELQLWVKTEFEKLGAVKIEDTGIEVKLSASKANRETNKRRALKEENKVVFSKFEEIVKSSIKKEDREHDERHNKDQEIYYNKFQIVDDENKINYEVNIYVDKPGSGDKNSYYAGHNATKIEIAPSDSQVANNSFNLHAKALIIL